MDTLKTDVRIPIGDVAKRYGRHVRSIERWIDDPQLDFPRPITIRRRRYILAAELLAWEQRFGNGSSELVMS